MITFKNPALGSADTAYGAPIFPWSYFIDQYSPSQIVLSPFNAPQFGAFSLFLMKCHNSNLYEAPPLENIWLLTGTNVTPLGGFQTNSQTKAQFYIFQK